MLTSQVSDEQILDYIRSQDGHADMWGAAERFFECPSDEYNEMKERVKKMIDDGILRRSYNGVFLKVAED